MNQSVKKLIKIFAGTVLIILFVPGGLLLYAVYRVETGRKEVDRLIENTTYPKFENIGTIDNLSILPLIDAYSIRNDLETEPGVSYLIKADNMVILMDVGMNRKRVHPSPLLKNMGAMDINISDIDMIFISHLHSDHLGGMTEQRKKEFSLSQGPVKLGGITVYSPDPLKPSRWNTDCKVETIAEPKVLSPGIASIGTIPRQLFLLGKTNENILAFNLKGKGIVLVVGCGHPTIERILDRTKMLFDERIYAIIGGLHFPVKGGRFKMGPIDIQYIVSSDRPPWRGVNEQDLENSISSIKNEHIKILSVSPHDSCDWSLEKFKHSFPDEWRDLRVGDEIKL